MYILGDANSNSGVTFVTNSVFIDVGSSVSATSAGYAFGEGPGAPPIIGDNYYVGGGGHGGLGKKILEFENSNSGRSR